MGLYRYSRETVKDNRAAEKFADYSSISEYAVPAVAWAVEKGIVNGVGNNEFHPRTACCSSAPL